MYVSFKLKKKYKEPQYKMNMYDEEMLEDMR